MGSRGAGGVCGVVVEGVGHAWAWVCGMVELDEALSEDAYEGVVQRLC